LWLLLLLLLLPARKNFERTESDDKSHGKMFRARSGW
jgi:hypothetical protein